MGYESGTKSYVLNDLHIVFQELDNGADLESAISAIGATCLDDIFYMIEEVRDNDE